MSQDKGRSISLGCQKSGESVFSVSFMLGEIFSGTIQ